MIALAMLLKTMSCLAVKTPPHYFGRRASRNPTILNGPVSGQNWSFWLWLDLPRQLVERLHIANCWRGCHWSTSGKLAATLRLKTFYENTTDRPGMGKSGYVPTNTCPFTSEETKYQTFWSSNTHNRNTMDPRVNSLRNTFLRKCANVLVSQEDGCAELLLPSYAITVHNVPTCFDQYGFSGER